MQIKNADKVSDVISLSLNYSVRNKLLSNLTKKYDYRV